MGHDDVDGFEDAYQGEWKSEGRPVLWPTVGNAWHIYEECHEHEMSEFASRYFNVEAFARDLFIDDYYFSDGHVFSRY